MSGKANRLDNAVAESFFATFKVELVYQSQWRTRTQARSEVFEYIDLFYNRQRRHSALGYLCPIEFELRDQWQLACTGYSSEVNQ
jgi:putative transposase